MLGFVFSSHFVHEIKKPSEASVWRSTLDVYVFMVWIVIMHVKQASRIEIHQVNSCEDLQNPQI